MSPEGLGFVSGVVTGESFFAVPSSVHPLSEIPKPKARTPAIVRLMTFRMEVPLILDSRRPATSREIRRPAA
jgi:hypothetical protein